MSELTVNVRPSEAQQRRRRWKSRLVTLAMGLSALVVMTPLFLVLYFLIREGASSLDWNFFTQLPKPTGETGGGMANAIMGTITLLAMASVLWYVFDRRARMLSAPPVTAKPAGQVPALAASPAPAGPGGSATTPVAAPAPTPAAGIVPSDGNGPATPAAQPVDLASHDGQTIDFSTGQPVTKQTPEDKAALDAGVKEIADATKDVTFDPPKKPAEPPAAPGKP